MSLPPDFQFSQSNLQDFVDCRRRFQLRYLLKIAWPALETEPVQESERWMQQGARFHRMLQQAFTGIPLERIAAQEMDADLSTWWANFQSRTPELLGFDLNQLPQPQLMPEITLTAPIGDYRLIGKFDLVLNRLPEKITIVDWKTSRRAPRREIQAARMQTLLYPYLMIQCSPRWNGGQPVQPEQVEMLYWYANDADKVQRFAYDARQYDRDHARLLSLVKEIADLPEEDFSLTSHVEACKYCVYRSLCDRGIDAGLLDAFDDELGDIDGGDYKLDFDQIAEVEF